MHTRRGCSPWVVLQPWDAVCLAALGAALPPLMAQSTVNPHHASIELSCAALCRQLRSCSHLLQGCQRLLYHCLLQVCGTEKCLPCGISQQLWARGPSTPCHSSLRAAQEAGAMRAGATCAEARQKSAAFSLVCCFVSFCRAVLCPICSFALCLLWDSLPFNSPWLSPFQMPLPMSS